MSEPVQYPDSPEKIAPLKRLVIPRDKDIVVGIFLGSAAFVALGYWIAVDPPKRREDAVFWGWFCVVVFGINALIALVRLISPKPALIIDEQGITDYASVPPAGFIPWSAISAASLVKVKRAEYLGLALKESYETGMTRRINKGWDGYAVNIPQMGVSMPLSEILIIVQDYLKRTDPEPHSKTESPGATQT